jgi:hypothetical protein
MLNNRRVRTAWHPAAYIRSSDDDADADRDWVLTATEPPAIKRGQQPFSGPLHRAEWFVFDGRHVETEDAVLPEVLARTERAAPL